MTVVRIEKVNEINTVTCEWGEQFTMSEVSAAFPDHDIREDVITTPSPQELNANPTYKRRDAPQAGAIEVDIDGVLTFVDPEQ